MKIIKDKEVTNHIENQIVLDIETTGVSRLESKIVICGLLSPYDGVKDNLLQFFIEDETDEKILLEAIYHHLDQKDLITFNGLTFDLPFIKDRFAFYGLEAPQEKSNLDIYRKLIQNKDLLALDKFSLIDAESILGIKRIDRIHPGLSRPYQDQLNQVKDPNLLVHNRNDLANTEKILAYRPIIEEIKSLKVLDENLYLVGKKLDKDYLYLSFQSDLDKNFYYESSSYLLAGKGKKRLVKIRLFKAYISPGIVGLCHLEEKPYLVDNSPYRLPENILLIHSDKKFYNYNIKRLVKKIYSDLPL